MTPSVRAVRRGNYSITLSASANSVGGIVGRAPWRSVGGSPTGCHQRTRAYFPGALYAPRSWLAFCRT